MILTDQEKEYITFIENGMIENFTSFLSIAFLEYEPLKKDFNKFINKEIVFKEKHYKIHNEVTYFGLDDITITANLQNDITAFISLLKTLEEHKLIFTLNLTSRHFPAILYYNDSRKLYEYRHFQRINDFIFEFKDTIIFSTPQLTSFINNNYLTDAELNNATESRDRKKSHNLTLYVAFLSIVVSSIVNFLLYNNSREVHINNTDPTQIEIKSIDTNILNLLNKPDSANSIK
ncbi:MAG: hypothetical protein HOP31_01055 [Ignavibacteria bacterium]|nr:hypothetical protein [Ignavibacteria bacterium]